MEKKTASAGFDGNEFYFEEKNGTRWVLLNVAEVVPREGIRRMEEVRRQETFSQKEEVVLSLLLSELRALGNGDTALAASMVLLLSVEAMSWNHRPYRFLRIGGYREDALSKGLERVMALIHPQCEFCFAGAKDSLPEGVFDGVLFDHLGKGREVLALEARKCLRPGGLLFCISGKKNGRNLLHLAKTQGQVFHCSPEVQLLAWERTREDCRRISRKFFGETSMAAFPRKKVIAFFPYKCSMWGFMDSIWRAADGDAACVAYVIPIPYADLGEEKKVREWHYEIEEFPSDVPVVKSDRVDVGHLRPDVAYIQYPYEDMNFVTRVEERFFARNLRPHVGQLVYVPYFMQGTCWAEHFLHVPCYGAVDKIVAQRSRMRVLSNGYNPLAQIKAGDVCFAEDILPPEKLLPLGTPVTDRILWCEGHKKIPAEWAERIGTRKVVLYNTSISQLVNHGEDDLRKMEYVFREFRGREDVILLWRPHPLMEDSLRYADVSRERYLALKQRFLDEDWGILDTTPDAEMSIAIADAYLGDPSSLLYMFGMTGKPAFLTSAMRLHRAPSEEELACIRFGANFFDGKTCFFRPVGYNAFCSMDMDSKEVRVMADFGDGPKGERYQGPWRDKERGNLFYFSPNRSDAICILDVARGTKERIPFREPLEDRNFGGAVSHGAYLYFLPNRYPAILRLHRKTREVAYFPLEDPVSSGNLFCGAVPYKDSLYFLSHRYPAIVELNCRTGEMRYHRECVEEIQGTRTPKCAAVMAGRCVRKGRYLLIAFRLTNRVLEFDMETGDWRCHSVGPEDADSNVMVKESEEVFWILPWQKGKIRRWDISAGSCRVVEDYPEGYTCAEDWGNGEATYRFSYVRRMGKEIWLFPFYGNMMLTLNMEKQRLEKWDVELPPMERGEGNPFLQQKAFIGMLDYGGKLWAQRGFDRKFMVIDKKTREVATAPAVFMEPEIAKSMRTPMAESFGPVGASIPYAVQEDMGWRSVGAFLDYVTEGKHDREAQRVKYAALTNHADGTCGAAIHEEMMRIAEGQGR